jgi:hypothetical protein
MYFYAEFNLQVFCMLPNWHACPFMVECGGFLYILSTRHFYICDLQTFSLTLWLQFHSLTYPSPIPPNLD